VRRVLLLAVVATTLAGASDATAAPLIPRELSSLSASSHALVRVSGAKGAAEARAAGGTVVSRHLGIWRLPSRDAQRLVPRLAVDGSIVDFEAEQPRSRTVRETADDPLRPGEWWLGMIDADRVAPPGPGRPLTVVDSGVDLTHPEFVSRPDTRVLGEQRLVGNSEFHGTAVTSVAAAPANGVGLVGVYPAALLGIWDASPRGILTSTAVIQGIDAALALGQGVINLSIGGTTRSGFEELAIFDAVARGSIIVAASGNEREEGDPPNYPASLPHVLTVGAVGQNGAVTSFSSTSVGMDVVAPGESIVAAVPSWLSPDLYETVDGTSFASPMVAAATAWVWTARPELDASQVSELVRRSARDLETPGRDVSSGFGILDVGNALSGPVPVSDPAEPNDSIAHVTADGLLHRATPPLTTRLRGRNAITARLDAADDPRDVYRVWVPAQRRVVAGVTSANPAIVTRLMGTTPKGIRALRTAQGLEIRNTGAAGREVFLAASLGRGTATYTLALTTSALPR
jgi:Subtilase family